MGQRGQLNSFFPHLHASCKIYREITRMMQFPPLKPAHRERRLEVRYCIVSSVIISKVQLGIFLQEYVCTTAFFSPSSHHFASITIHSPHCPTSSNRCQLLLTKLISHKGSPTTLLVITQSRELSVLLSLMGMGGGQTVLGTISNTNSDFV